MNWCAIGWMFVASAASAQGAPTHGQPIVLAHCAGGPTLTIAPTDPRAFLADDERDEMLAEARSRYPVLARDGFVAPAVLMWRRAPEEWLFVSLRPNGFADNALCVTATFTAKALQVTPALAAKYFAGGS